MRYLPPLEAIFVTVAGIDRGCYGFLDPIRRNDLLAFPNAIVNVKVTDSREVFRAQVQSAFGIDYSFRRAFPEIALDTKPCEQVFPGVVFNVVSGLLDVGQQLGGATTVLKHRARVVRHWPVDRELHPVVGSLHLTARIFGIVVCHIFIPIESG
jgi:hypothetical protein